MKQHRFGILAGISAVVFMSSTVWADDSVILKTKFQKGHTSYLQTSSESTSTVKGSMGGMEMKITKLGGHIRKIESSNMDGVEMTIIFDRMKFGLDSQVMGQLKFDSDIPSVEDAPYLKQMFDPLMGKTLRITLRRDHKVSDIAGIDEIVEKVEKSAGGNPFAMGFRQSFNREIIGKHFDDIHLTRLPGKQVKVGDKWNFENEDVIQQFGVGVKFDCTARLDRLGEFKGNRAAFVSFEGKPTSLYQKVDTGRTPPLEVEKGTMKGAYVFDLEQGMIVDETIDNDFSVRQTRPKDADGGNAASPMTVTIKARHQMAILPMKEREAEKVANAKKAAELKEREEAEDAEGDDSADDSKD